ncbi:MAG TPA: hypothetical protein VH022_14315 [Candidatus Acidoferrum sp.]|jgi:hypothetical protein|nr:hypothetical protein [Candidatus Acidoferrum sp.]
MTLWKVGDRVRFRHQAESGPTFVVTASGLVNDLVEIDGLSGQFAQELFVAEGYPADSAVPPPPLRAFVPNTVRQVKKS